MNSPFEFSWSVLKAWYDEEHPSGFGPGEEGHDPKAPENIMPSEEKMHYMPADDNEESIRDSIMMEHDDPEMAEMAWQHWVHQNTDRGEFVPEYSQRNPVEGGFMSEDRRSGDDEGAPAPPIKVI